MKKYIILAAVIAFGTSISYAILNARRDQTTFTPLSASSAPRPVGPTNPISISDVSKHSIRTDCWLIIDGSVYNMTSFIDSHPGGDAIVKGCGHDATILFDSPKESHDGSKRLFTNIQNWGCC